MSGKTLSNGTLSLRFMQNAQRAKLEAQVEAEHAKVKDDAEWEVSKEVKEAWGIHPTASQSKEAVVHESSYVPFLFSSLADSEGASSSVLPPSAPRLRGRRTFDAQGQEVVKQEKQEHPSDDENDAVDTRDENAQQRGTKRPTSISGFRAPAAAAKDAKKPRKKTAQMLIRESAVVHPAPSLRDVAGQNPLSGVTGFVKPAGIDEPAETSRRGPASLKRVREQDSNAGQSAVGAPKRTRKANIP